MPTIADYLKYANLQMAAEAFIRDEDTGILATSTADIIDALKAGNTRASKFTETEAIKFESEWTVVDQCKNTPTGFSGTLFKNRATGELVVSFRSTEFVDDAIRDSASTNSLDVFNTGWAWGQIADMEAWYAQLKSDGKIPSGSQINATGYSLGGHLATAFNLLRREELNQGPQTVNVTQVVTFNGAGVGEVKSGTLQEAINDFNELRSDSNKLRTALDLSLTDSKQYYADLLQKLADKSWTERQALDALLEWRGKATHADIFTQETQPLYNALTDILKLQAEAERINGFVSGDSTPNLKPVPATEILAQTLDYRLAVYFASQQTSSVLSVLDKMPGNRYSSVRILQEAQNNSQWEIAA